MLAGRLRPGLAKRLSLVAKILWVIAAIVFAIGSTRYDPPPSWLLVPWGALITGGFGTMIASWIMSLWPNTRERELPPADQITSAHVQSFGRVELGTRNGDEWIVDMADEKEARAYVEGLGFGWGGKPVTYRLGSKNRRFLHFALAYISYQFGSLLGMVGGMLFALALQGLKIIDPQTSPIVFVSFAILAAVLTFVVGKRLLQAPEITVGNDGVHMKTLGGFRRRFLPIRDIAMVHQTAVGAPARIKMQDGSVVHMAGFIVDSARRDAAATHIRALLAHQATLQKSPVLARDGRSIKEWREHLRRVVEGSGYRMASTNESLVDLVAAPGLTTEERVGAALALRIADDSNVPKIRIAAEQCVDPKTRAALEAAAREEIDEQAIENILR